MRYFFASAFRKSRLAQTFVFFVLSCVTIFLLCGLAIDSGLLYLAKARLGRAVDGAALAAVGNFNRSTDPATNRDDVALIMRNFATVNFTDLAGHYDAAGVWHPLSSTTTSVSSTYTTSSGLTGTLYTYKFHTDDEQDANGQYKRFVQVVLTSGAGGGITSATCSARCPTHTYFIGYAGSYFRDLKVSSAAVATRHPRLIMIVIDRSASMLQPNGGAFGLASGVVTFLNFFDTTSDMIGIVSFSSNARLEMPLTTNFLVAGTNILYNTYQTNTATGTAKGNGSSNGNGNGNGHSTYTAPYATPGVDPEQTSDANYATEGVRRMKFGGQTAADEGMRLAMEQLMANSGFNNPDILKYVVLFTDGAWNAARTLVAAPGYTNVIICPAQPNGNNPNYRNVSGSTNNPYFVTNNTYQYASNLVVPVPTLSPNGTTNSSGVFTPGLASATNVFFFDYSSHTNDYWLSRDTNSALERMGLPTPTTTTNGYTQPITNYTYVGTNTSGDPLYTTTINLWLQPGAVAYVYPAHGNGKGSKTGTYVSDYTNPTLTTNIELVPDGECDVVVPGYLIDGIVYDGLDLAYEDDVTADNVDTYPRYRLDNYNTPYMWPDDTNTENPTSSASGYPYYAYSDQSTPYLVRSSKERELMFRNYANLLTGFTVYRPDDPPEYDSSGQNVLDPLITDSDFVRPLNGLGPWYPGAAMYWPFDFVGVDWDATYCLLQPTYDPESSAIGFTGATSGLARHASYTINMSQTYANPEWAGEWFYRGTNAGVSGTTSASSLLTSKSDWQIGVPSFVTNNFDNSTCTTTEAAHDTNISPNPSVWRPLTFNGYNVYTTNGDLVGSSTTSVPNGVSPSDSSNKTGGYVTDGAGNYYRNAMAWSGRPTHYYDFSTSTWKAFTDNHHVDIQMLPLCNWKMKEYAWHARALGVTIYTMGYGGLVSDSEQALLATIANSTNTTAGGGSNMPYNNAQPVGGQYFATNAAGISNAFYQVASAIAAALTQ